MGRPGGGRVWVAMYDVVDGGLRVMPIDFVGAFFGEPLDVAAAVKCAQGAINLLGDQLGAAILIDLTANSAGAQRLGGIGQDGEDLPVPLVERVSAVIRRGGRGTHFPDLRDQLVTAHLMAPYSENQSQTSAG
ncbi:hypothetical protein A5761_24200 [Mycolicibacterium setense]|nr:hypothetical protein A5761_24200 [Mycolicibacterium setense]